VFYLIELVLMHWLVGGILGQPGLFWAAVAVALVLFIVKGVFSD
jgi:hypothetical protein